MAGARGSRVKASAMNCQVVTTTLKLRSYVSSLLPDHPGSDRTLSATAESGVRIRQLRNGGVWTSKILKPPTWMSPLASGVHGACELEVVSNGTTTRFPTLKNRFLGACLRNFYGSSVGPRTPADNP